VIDRESELADDLEQVAITPGGGSITLPVTGGSRFLELREQGFYEVRPPGSNPDRAFSVAVNVDVAESDLDIMDPTELAGAVAPRETSTDLGANGLATPEVRARDQERRQALWRFLIAGALILLLTETAASNWLSRTAAKRFDDGREYAALNT
jgi:hypothetical protein